MDAADETAGQAYPGGGRDEGALRLARREGVARAFCFAHDV